MRSNPILLFLATVLLTVSLSCENGQSTQEENPLPDETPAPSRAYKVPAFIADSAYSFVEKQVNFGPRVPNSDGHSQTKEWLVGKLQSYGLNVIRQDFQAIAYTGAVLNGTNIIAEYNPAARRRILLAAHWDTRHIADSPLSQERQGEPILGADDGGSGVGILLEIARQLQVNPIEAGDLGVDLILFDLEDYGESGGKENSYCLGSQHWARNLHHPDYRPQYGILLDMVGTAGARFTKDQVSMAYAGPIMNKVWSLAKAMGFGHLFVDIPSGGLIDDHYYVNTIAGIPMIDIINKPAGSSTGFGAHWHTHDDDMDVIDRSTLRAVGQVLLAVVYREAGGSF